MGSQNLKFDRNVLVRIIFLLLWWQNVVLFKKWVRKARNKVIKYQTQTSMKKLWWVHASYTHWIWFIWASSDNTAAVKFLHRDQLSSKWFWKLFKPLYRSHYHLSKHTLLVGCIGWYDEISTDLFNCPKVITLQFQNIMLCQESLILMNESVLFSIHSDHFICKSKDLNDGPFWGKEMYLLKQIPLHIFFSIEFLNLILHFGFECC